MTSEQWAAIFDELKDATNSLWNAQVIVAGNDDGWDDDAAVDSDSHRWCALLSGLMTTVDTLAEMVNDNRRALS